MDLLTILGTVGAAAAIAFAMYVTVAFILLALALRVAARQEDIPLSLDCRDGHHAACLGCSCPHHQ